MNYTFHMKKYDLVIIGGGPAGLTAGIYAKRGGLDVVIVEKMSIGGQTARTLEIENYPGFSNVSGFELSMQMQNQCKDLGVEFVFGEISKYSLKGKTKEVVVGDETYQAQTVIIATGTVPTFLGVENEKTFAGRGVSYCATCDGGFFRDKIVAVVGGGNVAIEDALYLKRFAKSVHLIHRRDEYRASKILVDKLKENKIVEHKSAVIESIEGDNKVSHIMLKNLKNNKVEKIELDGLFIAIGQTPKSDVFTDVAKDSRGYIIADENMATSVDGVFAAGDVIVKNIRQIVTACADGAIAAESVLKYLN